MKLNLGENIRYLRKKADMTQEQLADRLGVSYQSVSRWENGGTYPDLELIPAISKIFSISADTLLGMPEQAKEEKAQLIFDDLRREALRAEIDADKVVELIREIRRSFIDSAAMYRFWCEGNERCYSHPKVLPEVRLTAEAFFDVSKNAFDRNSAVEVMACIEEEEHLDAFLERHAPAFNITQGTLKAKRYMMRGEWDKHEEQRRLELFLMIDNLCDARNFKDRRETSSNASRELMLNTFQLGVLNRFCDCEDDVIYPVSGDSGVDFWAEIRLILGFRQGAYLCGCGRYDEAYSILEDGVKLLERVMSISEATELKCSSPWLQGLSFTAEPCYFNLHNDPDGREEANVWIHASDGSTYMIYPSVYHKILTDEGNWGWFDPIRKDERFKRLVSRVAALIRYKE